MSCRQSWRGNPSDKPKTGEVDFSKKEVLSEKVEIYRQSDHGCIEARGGWSASAGDVPGIGHRHSNVLQVACQVWQHGHFHSQVIAFERLGRSLSILSQEAELMASFDVLKFR
jgi:hypothetical protein